jgi:hypothetical protein
VQLHDPRNGASLLEPPDELLLELPLLELPLDPLVPLEALPEEEDAALEEPPALLPELDDPPELPQANPPATTHVHSRIFVIATLRSRAP